MIALGDATIGVERRALLHGVDATIASGAFVALLGPNGVGKTTLLRTLAGTNAPFAGTIRVGDVDPHGLAPIERARRIAFVASDDAPLPGLLVRDVVASGRYPFHRWWQWGADASDDAAIAGALDAVGMRAFERRRFETLSSGERQRIWIALALAQEAPVLLLDEPTSHLDVRVAHEILALLRDQARAGRTVVCAMHDLNDAAAYADRLMLLGDERMLAFDAPERVLESATLEAAYGVRMEAVRLRSGATRVFVV